MVNGKAKSGGSGRRSRSLPSLLIRTAVAITAVAVTVTMQSINICICICASLSLPLALALTPAPPIRTTTMRNTRTAKNTEISSSLLLSSSSSPPPLRISSMLHLSPSSSSSSSPTESATAIESTTISASSRMNYSYSYSYQQQQQIYKFHYVYNTTMEVLNYNSKNNVNHNQNGNHNQNQNEYNSSSSSTSTSTTLEKGKHHQLFSLLQAWSNLITDVGIIELTELLSVSHDNDNNNSNSNYDEDNDDDDDEDKYEHKCTSIAQVPILMEKIVQRLVHERDVNKNSNIEGELSTKVYNLIVHAWCAAATASIVHINANAKSNANANTKSNANNSKSKSKASHVEAQSQLQLQLQQQLGAMQRAFDIVKQLQHMYEQTGNEALQPNQHSFQLVMRAYSKLALSISSFSSSSSSSSSLPSSHLQSGSSRSKSKSKSKLNMSIIRQEEKIFIMKKILHTVYTIFSYQEYIYRTNRNSIVKPKLSSYTVLMELYSKCVVLNSNSRSSSSSSRVGRSGSDSGSSSGSSSKSNKNRSNINGNVNVNDNANESDKQINTNDMEWRCGYKTEQIFRLMQVQNHVQEPNTYSYNLVISAYMKQHQQQQQYEQQQYEQQQQQQQNYRKRNKRRRNHNYNNGNNLEAIKSAQRIFDEMQNRYKRSLIEMETGTDTDMGMDMGISSTKIARPDIISYTSLITAWANCNCYSGYSAQKAQDLLFQLEEESLRLHRHRYHRHRQTSNQQNQNMSDRDCDRDHDHDQEPILQPNTILYNAVLKAWCKSNHPDAIQNAFIIFQRMRGPCLLQLETKNNDSDTTSRPIMNQRKTQKPIEYEYEYDDAEDDDDEYDNMVKPEPDRTSFNAILHALCKKGTKESLQHAEYILNEMEQYEEKGCVNWSPNLFSYNIIIEGYSKKCGDGGFSDNNHNNSYSNVAARDHFALKAYHVLQRLLIAQKKQEKKRKRNDNGNIPAVDNQERRLGSYGNKLTRKNVKRPQQFNVATTLSPDTFSFNNVIFALTKSRLKKAPLLVEEILLYMEREYDEKGRIECRPDVYTYSSAITSWARSGENDAGARAEALLLRMEERSANGERRLKPNVVTFNSVIDCYAKSGQGLAGAIKAEQILERMECMYSAGDDSVKPNANSYNSVILAWARSDTRCAHWKSLKVLNKMWKLYKDGNEDVKPDLHAYNTVITAVSKSDRADKAQRALRLLRKMDKLYVHPNEITYTCVLNSCAYSISVHDGDLRQKEYIRRKALDTAMFTLEELMESPNLQPNHVFYGTFLRCCANLIDDEHRRITVVEPVFLQCVKDGQVGQIVLNQLRLAAPDELYQKLLGNVIQKSSGTSTKRDRVSIEDLPSEWRCNVRNEKWKDRRRVVRKKSKNFKRKHFNRSK